jgi:hypothetical protein
MMNQAYLSEEEVVRVTNDEYVTIKRDDLQGEYDLTVEISTPERDNEMAAKLIMLMQTNQANMNQELAQKIYSKIARLWKMFDLGDDIEQFKPQPSEEEVKMQQMQMENLMLENKKLNMEILAIAKALESEDSKIQERKTRGVENINADVELKRAKAKVAIAEAEKILAETDVIEQEFLAEYDNPLSKQERHERDKEFDAMTELEKEQMKLAAKEKPAEAGSDAGGDGIERYINLNL